MRFIVLKGRERRDIQADYFETKLRYVPASSFLEEYERTDLTLEIKRISQQYLQEAAPELAPTADITPTLEDVQNGVKSYVVARQILRARGG